MNHSHVLVVLAASPAAAASTAQAWLRTCDLPDVVHLRPGAPSGLSAVSAPVPAAAAAGLRRVLRNGTDDTLAAAVVPAGLGQGGGIIVTDVDSTLIEQEVIELLAAHAGREAEVAAVTERAMRGELDFAASLHHRVRALTGLPVSLLAEVAETVLPTDGARALVHAAHVHGYTVGAVSGGFLQVLQPLAESLRLDHAEANVLGVRDGLLTGTVEGPVVDRAAKAAALRRWAGHDGVDPARSVGLGDGANDLDLLAAAALGVAVQPKPVLREAADAVIGVPRLDAVATFLDWDVPPSWDVPASGDVLPSGVRRPIDTDA